jgi:hypothetical protein
MPADAKGRFVPRTGGPVTPGPACPEIVPPLDVDDDENGWGIRIVSAGFAIDLRAEVLVDAMTRATLAHHRESILSGQRPDGGGPQRPLGQRALADPDRQSPHRGYKSGELADGIRRTAIKSSGGGTEATSRIVGPPSRNAYLGKEAARGVVLVTGAGRAGEVATAAAAACVEAMVSGREVLNDRGETTAKETDE